MAARFQLRAVRGHFDAELLKGEVGIFDLVFDGSVLKYRSFSSELGQHGVCAVLYHCTEQVYDLAGGLRDGRCLCYGRLRLCKCLLHRLRRWCGLRVRGLLCLPWLCHLRLSWLRHSLYLCLLAFRCCSGRVCHGRRLLLDCLRWRGKRIPEVYLRDRGAEKLFQCTAGSKVHAFHVVLLLTHVLFLLVQRRKKAIQNLRWFCMASCFFQAAKFWLRSKGQTALWAGYVDNSLL